MEFGKSGWRTYEQGIQREWLLTNGMGGFASSTLIGANTRRYHGLLVASLKPPVQRHLVLSKLDETAELDGRSYNLYSHTANGSVMKGFHNLQRVVIDPLPTFIYSIEDTIIEKTICMVHGENTVVVAYNIINGQSRLKLRLSPLVNFRDYHGNSSRYHMKFKQKSNDGGTAIIPYDMDIEIKLSCTAADYHSLDGCWFENMHYAVEQERGLTSAEDHYIPGFFDIIVGEGQEKQITFTATIEKNRSYEDGISIIKRERERIKALSDAAGYEDRFASMLSVAADNFIVYRKSTDAKTIIAGYPWFTDWGRDTMIALCGLTLVTGRYKDAEQILYTFSRYINNGLIPNMFPDEGQEPFYNSVDAVLWFFEAVNKYIQYTGNYEFVRTNLYSPFKGIIHAFSEGTSFGIGMDEDGLVAAGDQFTQLTWMDAKIGSWVVTPRQGKAVEINALWYNALCIMSKLAEHFGDDGRQYSVIAGKAKEAFGASFWNEKDKCLYDVINGDYRDESIRPNQILAVSLSYPVIEGGTAKAVVLKVWKELYTSFGLRSLSASSQNYRGIYMGDQHSRDGAYHQGTVWTWPLGHFITAFTRVFGKDGRYGEIAASFFEPFKDHLQDACVGSISEIFDGDEPLYPRGCFAQAWSVGEILRAYIENR